MASYSMLHAATPPHELFLVMLVLLSVTNTATSASLKCYVDDTYIDIYISYLHESTWQK